MWRDETIINLEFLKAGDAGGGVPAEALTHADAVAVHDLLAQILEDPQAAADWKQRCAKVFRWSSFFQGQDRVDLGHYVDKADGDSSSKSVDTNGIVDALKNTKLDS